MKPQELRSLDDTELTGKLKESRRELFELRFKLAVGQLDNHREILKVRKDIARILTVMHEQRGEGPELEPARSSAATAIAERPVTPEPVAVEDLPAAEAVVAEKKPARKRAATKEDKE